MTMNWITFFVQTTKCIFNGQIKDGNNVVSLGNHCALFSQILTEVLIPATMQEMPERFVLLCLFLTVSCQLKKSSCYFSWIFHSRMMYMSFFFLCCCSSACWQIFATLPNTGSTGWPLPWRTSQNALQPRNSRLHGASSRPWRGRRRSYTWHRYPLPYFTQLTR